MIKRGRIISPEKVLNCVVLDLSATGAGIYLTDSIDVPETVLLRLPDGVVRAARRRWQQDVAVGFEFLETRIAEETPDAGGIRLNQAPRPQHSHVRRFKQQAQ
jgi:hypothetical protein